MSWNQKAADQLIPEYMHAGLRRYIEDRTPPGGFLTAVLENDLREAVHSGDLNNLRCLVGYVTYLYNHAPRECWGSPKKVQEWLNVDPAPWCGHCHAKVESECACGPIAEND